MNGIIIFQAKCWVQWNSLHHARTEWSVETMHWLLDVHFEEDRCRVQSKNIQQNLNMLHKFALNIVRINKRETQSKLALNGIMLRSLMNPYHLLHLLGKTWFPCLSSYLPCILLCFFVYSKPHASGHYTSSMLKKIFKRSERTTFFRDKNIL